MERTDAVAGDGARTQARWPVPVIFAIGAGLMVFGQIFSLHNTSAEKVTTALVVLAAAIVWCVAAKRKEWWQPRLYSYLEKHTAAIDGLSDRHLTWWIGLASGVALFAELTVIRWHASSFQLFAYFKNVSLLAAFLGLGIGFASGQRRPLWTPLFLPALCLQFLLMHWLRFSSLHELLQNPVSEQQALGMATLAVGTLAKWSHTTLSYGFLILVFASTVLTCLPLGQLVARLMARRPALSSYGVNLLGSLAGIGVFTLVSYLWSPPTVWLLGTALGVLPFLLLGRSLALATPSLLALGLAQIVLALPYRSDLIEVYSPYQYLALEISRSRDLNLRVNHTYFQCPIDLREEARRTDDLRNAARYYNLPYHFQEQPGRVLVVGSGTGNDVAAALRNQAGHVDAVEIDPAILRFGKTIHPEDPYHDGRVEPIVEDARGFIRHTDREYDLIVYGLLDSHTLLSGMSTVRLDSFVYTVEAFREARARLSAHGIIAMTFCLCGKTQERKFFLMLKEAFDGEEPRVFFTNYNNGTTFLIGPGLSLVSGKQPPVTEVTAEYAASTLHADVSTDDWPFLYMGVRKYPKSYAVMLGLLLVVSLALLRQLLPALDGQFSWPCFFLGAGFMLVETKGITELSLVFGSTWQVVSVVIAGILIMAYLANWMIGRVGTLHPVVAYGLLGGALWLGMNVSGAAFAGLPPLAAKVLATGLVTLPLFFSGFAFSSEIKQHGNISAALSANLFGAMLGGFCEYNSMYFGFRSLYLFAIVLYGLAFAAVVWRWHVSRQVKSDSPAPPAARAA